MAKWQRLSTPKRDDDDIIIHQSAGTSLWLAWGFMDDGEVVKDVRSIPLLLVPAELLALARKRPEVQALIEAARLARDMIDPREVLDPALAPFEE